MQQETQALDSFLNEFYRLQNNIYTISDKMDIDGHARILHRCFRSKRKELSKQNLNHASYEDQASKYVLEAIEHKSFERFALSVRMAMHHIEASNPKEAYRYGLIIRDTMTIAERIVFLNWIFYYWPTAKKWFVSYKDKDGNKHPYDYTRGLNPEDFISDEVYNYFYQEPPKNK